MEVLSTEPWLAWKEQDLAGIGPAAERGTREMDGGGGNMGKRPRVDGRGGGEEPAEVEGDLGVSGRKMGDLGVSGKGRVEVEALREAEQWAQKRKMRRKRVEVEV